MRASNAAHCGREDIISQLLKAAVGGALWRELVNADPARGNTGEIQTSSEVRPEYPLWIEESGEAAERGQRE